MSPKDFEKFVQSLFESKLPNNYKTFHRKHYKGKTGQTYEIDISFEANVSDIKYITLCECKLYNAKNPVGVNIVNELIAKLKDIGAHKGILITSSNFQKGVYTIAKTENVALILIKNDSLVVELPSSNSLKLNKSILFNNNSYQARIYLHQDEDESLFDLTHFFGKPFIDKLFS